MSRRPAVTILAIDPDNPTRWLEVRGTVVGETEEGANEHIERRVPRFGSGAWAPAYRLFRNVSGMRVVERL